MRSFLFVVGTALVLASCQNPLDGGDDYVRIRQVSAGLELTNQSSAPAYYFAADADFLALASFALCSDPSQCPSVAAHASRVVAFGDIPGYSTSTHRVSVSYWHFVPKNPGPGYDQTAVRSTVVTLP